MDRGTGRRDTQRSDLDATRVFFSPDRSVHQHKVSSSSSSKYSEMMLYRNQMLEEMQNKLDQEAQTISARDDDERERSQA